LGFQQFLVLLEGSVAVAVGQDEGVAFLEDLDVERGQCLVAEGQAEGDEVGSVFLVELTHKVLPALHHSRLELLQFRFSSF
jgi:hypothetical protein